MKNLCYINLVTVVVILITYNSSKNNKLKKMCLSRKEWFKEYIE